MIRYEDYKWIDMVEFIEENTIFLIRDSGRKQKTSLCVLAPPCRKFKGRHPLRSYIDGATAITVSIALYNKTAHSTTDIFYQNLM